MGQMNVPFLYLDPPADWLDLGTKYDEVPQYIDALCTCTPVLLDYFSTCTYFVQSLGLRFPQENIKIPSTSNESRSCINRLLRGVNQLLYRIFIERRSSTHSLIIELGRFALVFFLSLFGSRIILSLHDSMEHACTSVL